MGRTVIKQKATENSPEVVDDQEFPLSQEKQKWLFEAMEEVHYRWHLFNNASDPVGAAYALTDFNDKLGDLMTYHPGYSYENGTFPWERNADD